MDEAVARGEAALYEDLQRNAALIELEQIDPRALVRVVTDIQRREYGLTDGNSLRQCWESNSIQRVSPDFNDVPIGAERVRCPDGKIIFIKFSSTKFQLLGDPEANIAAGVEDNSVMAEKKHNPPPKKTTPVKPAASKTVAKETKVKKPSDGTQLGTDAQRSTLRAGVKQQPNLIAARDFLLRAGTSLDDIWKRLNSIVMREAKNKGAWMFKTIANSLVE